MSFVNALARFGGPSREQLRKALNSASNSGGALIPQHLEQWITNTVIRLSPVHALLQPEFSPQKLHEFNRVTSLGSGGQSMGENATTPSINSTYQRSNVTLKIVRRKGAVTDFLQESSKNYINAIEAEIENQVRAQAYDLEYFDLWGNADANTYEFSGFDHLITTNRFNTGFSSGAPTVLNSLKPLDAMIDASNRKGGYLHKRAFICSPEMLSTISRQLTNVRLNQPVGAGGEAKVNIGGGWRLDSYRDIPIVQSSFVGGASADTMGTVTASSGGTTGGSLSNGTYYFRVAPVTYNGEGIASAESSVTLSGGTATQQIALTFTAVSGAISYKVYYSSTTGLTGMTLIDWQTANVYDGSGTITGAGTVASLAILSTTPTTAATGQTSDKPLTTVAGVNGESIFLVDLDPIQGLGKFPYTNAGGRVSGVVSFEYLAKTDAFLPFLIYTHGAICPSFEGTSAVSRGWLVA